MFCPVAHPTRDSAASSQTSIYSRIILIFFITRFSPYSLHVPIHVHLLPVPINIHYVFPTNPFSILHTLLCILCYIYNATSIIRSLFHIHKPHLGFSCSYFSYTPTAWVFSPESFSLRPFRQHILFLTHHLWVFPPSASPLRPPRGFSPRKFPLCAHFASID